MRGEDRTLVTESQAARIVAAIVSVRTKQLDLQIRTNRYRGRMTDERRYRAAELHARLADLRAELGACEHETLERDTSPPAPPLEGRGAQGEGRG